MQNKSEKEFLLRCIAYEGKNGGKDGYFAICLDLSVTTWRPNLQSAISSLNQAISGYIETKAQLEPELCQANFKKLIYNPAPIFPYWAKYYSAKLFPKNKNEPNPPKIYNRPINQNTFCTA